MAENKPIIVKKIKKGHGAAHGGSWKVAYADFVTAMMAFFLLLWLVSMVMPEKRARISEYFKEFSLFEFSKGVPIEQGGAMVVIPGQPGPPIPQNPEMKIRPPKSEIEQVVPQEEEKEALRQTIEQKLKDLKDQVFVDSFDNGVRIELVYKEGYLYEAGSIQLTDAGRRALKVVADGIKDLPNKIAIEGHTDATPPSNPQYTNWELSTARASAARVVLEQFGVRQDRLLRVAGYAAIQPIIAENPNDPRNRRISILLFNAPKKPGLEVAPKVPLQTAVDQELNATIGRITERDVVAIKPPPH